MAATINTTFDSIYLTAHLPEEVSIETPIDVDDNAMSEEDEEFILGVEEKPISQWSKTEVKKYAELKRIDITGTKNVNEAKAIIKEFLG